MLKDGYTSKGVVTPHASFLALDQGMIAAALTQRLSPGLLRRPFCRGGFTARVKPLLKKEAFSIA